MNSTNHDATIFSLFDEGKENEALQLLINSYKSKLYWHIRRLLIDHSLTDDALQNTFIKVWKGLPQFKRESKLYTWLFKIATNEAFTALEKNKKSSTTLSLSSEYNFDSAQNLRSDQLSDDLSGEAIQLKLEQAIAQLPEKQRLVFHLKYYEELKYEEIEEIVGTSVGALKASYHHAVKKIELFVTSH